MTAKTHDGTAVDYGNIDVGQARFRFDPEHDPLGAPSREAFLAWIRTAMANPDRTNALGDATRSCRRIGACLSAWIPAARRMTDWDRVDDRPKPTDDGVPVGCDEWNIARAMPHIVEVHDLMREFGVDMIGLPDAAGIIERMLTILVLDQSIEAGEIASGIRIDRSKLTDGAETLVSSHERVRPYMEILRHHLESKALLNLMRSVKLRADWRQYVAALRSSYEDVTSEVVRGMITNIVDRLERELS